MLHRFSKSKCGNKERQIPTTKNRRHFKFTQRRIVFQHDGFGIRILASANERLLKRNYSVPSITWTLRVQRITIRFKQRTSHISANDGQSTKTSTWSRSPSIPGRCGNI